MDVDYWKDLLAPVARRHRWIVIGGPLAGLISSVKELRALGSERVLVLGSDRGTGPIPEAEEADCVMVCADEPPAADVVEGFHRYEARLGDLPPEARRAVERFDPRGEALAVGRILLSPVPDVAGRPRWAAEDPQCRRLEDKCVLPEFLAAHALPAPPSEVVPAEGAALDAAAVRLDRGMGTAWAGDARDGLHGGATLLRWVRTPDDAREAHQMLAARCDRVRVTPFLEGIPCSVHAIVSGDAIAVFRPIEMVTLRRPGESKLVYSGVATWWDPAPADRESMRDIARRCAAALRADFGFRGTFTVDGVLTANGFAITELNVRIGGALTLLEERSGVPLGLLAQALRAGELEGDPRLAELEEHVLARVDAERVGRAMALLSRAGDGETRPLVRANGAWRLAAEGEPSNASVVWGPGPTGGFLRLVAQGDALAPGPPFAPEAVGLLRWAEHELGAEIGALEPALPVR